MYFKQKNYFLLNKKEKNDVRLFSNIEQLKVFHSLFDDFIKYHHKKLVKQDKICPFLDKSDDLYKLKLSTKFENKFRVFLNILDEMIKNNWSQKQYFKENKQSLFKRSSWYEFKNKIIKLANKFINGGWFDWTDKLGKLPIKIHINKKYNDKEIDFIVDQYKSYISNEFDFEITDFWLKIRNNEIYRNLQKISIKTIKRFLFERLGVTFVKKKKRYLVKHPKRRYIANSGIIQLDLKIIGQKDTRVKKKVTVFNMIETKTRFSFSKVLETGSIENILNALDEGKKHFEKYGIQIKAIQTDNAMMFKGTNFINSDNYNAYLRNHNIIKRLIPLGVPECNGCIERFHLTIDKKCQTLLSYCETVEQVREVINKFSYEYNFNRYHYYSELEKREKKYCKRYLIPINAIKELYNYH